MARREAKLSQIELAERVDAHRSTIVRWESDVTAPTYDQVLTLAEKLEKQPDWFYPDSVEPTMRPDPWLAQVPWERVQELTAGALRSQRLGSAALAARSGVGEARIRELLKGKRPTREEIRALRQGLGEGFDPTPQLARAVPPPIRRATVSDADKLDLILIKLNRLEEFLGLNDRE